MSRIAYVNGAYVPMQVAHVHIDDRGFQFADGVYEVVTIRHGKMIDMDAHLVRLKRSLDAIEISVPMSRGALLTILKETVRRNRARDALLYIQVTRGVAKRNHAFPSAHTRPGLVITCRSFNLDAVREKAKVGISAVTQPDNRWGRCDIKATGLLPNVLAKQAATVAGAAEAVFTDSDGYITEGSSTNIWMVTADGTLVTRSTDDNILPGITRAAIMNMAADCQIKIEERAFTVEEAKGAAELFLTSSTQCAMPIVSLDGHKIGDGTPGPVTNRLIDIYWSMMDQ